MALEEGKGGQNAMDTLAAVFVGKLGAYGGS
jgi:hypothetical protein